jgi:hypothetical protein
MSVADRFHRIGKDFNERYLDFLHKFYNPVLYDEEGNPEPDVDAEAVDMARNLEKSYASWFSKLQENVIDEEPVILFNKYSSRYHNLILARDEQFFVAEGGFDFLSSVYKTEDVNSKYMFWWYAVDPEDLGEDEDDPQSDIWDGILKLYRMATLICVYLEDKLVKQIIDVIMKRNPDINAQNSTQLIAKDFVKSPNLRSLLVKLLRKRGKEFQIIMDKLQRLIETFSDSIKIDKDAQDKMEKSHAAAIDATRALAEEMNIVLESDEELEELFQTLKNKDKETLNSFSEKHNLSRPEKKHLQNEFSEKNIDKMDPFGTMSTMSTQMNQLMSAYQTGDESAMQDIIKQTGAHLNLSPEDMAMMEKESEGIDWESDESEEVDEDDNE